MDALCTRINRMIAQCTEKGEGYDEKRALADQIISQLLDADLAVEELLQNHKIAIHPENRDTTGVDPLEVHNLLERICRDGFCLAELGVRWAFEKRTEGYKAEEERVFNFKVVAGSEGLLAVPQWDDVEALAVACTHTVTGFNAAEGKAAGIAEDLCVDGRLSKEKIVQHFPATRAAFQFGFKWVKIRTCVQDRCPSLAAFLSDAANKPHGAHRLSTVTQSMLQLHGAGKRNQDLHNDPKWRAVAANFNQRRPDLNKAGADLCAFVDKWAGGAENPSMLKEIDAFGKCFG